MNCLAIYISVSLEDHRTAENAMQFQEISVFNKTITGSTLQLVYNNSTLTLIVFMTVEHIIGTIGD